jgi:predicted PurR-regulated permease PerM
VEAYRTVVDIPARTVVKVLLIVFAAIGLVQVASRVTTVLIWMAISFFLALVLLPGVRLAERWMPRAWAVFTVFVTTVLLLCAFLAVLIVPLATQVDDLAKAAPGYIADLEKNKQIRDLNKRYNVIAKAQAQVADAPGKLFGALGRVASGVVAAITVLFLTLFLMLELPRLTQTALAFMRPEHADRARRLAVDVQRNVGGYVAGNLIISVIAGTTTYIALAILNVPYALALALLMGLFDLIPLVGATIGALAAIGVAFATQGPTAGIVMIAVNVIYQQVENHILQPVIYRRTVQLSSFVVMVAVLLGGALLGVFGALIAIPVAGSLQIIARDLLASRMAQAEPPAPAAATP